MKYKSEYNYHKGNLLDVKIEYNINNRPKEINIHLYYGHFESDTVLGTKNDKHEFNKKKNKILNLFRLKKLWMKL